MLSIRQKKDHIHYTKYMINNTRPQVISYYEYLYQHPPFDNIYPIVSKLQGLSENTLMEVFAKISENTKTDIKSPYTTLMWVPDADDFSSRTSHDRPWDYTARVDMGERQTSYYPEVGQVCQTPCLRHNRVVRRLEDASMPRFKQTPIIDRGKKPTPAQVNKLLRKPKVRKRFSMEDQQLVVSTVH